jgi:hypothetical protein
LFWISLLYNAALWLCPPGACFTEVFDTGPHSAPPAPPDMVVCAPPPVCAMVGMPKKTYAAEFRFPSERNVCIMQTGEEYQFNAAMISYPDANCAKGMKLVTCMRRGGDGQVQLACDLERVGQGKEHLQAVTAVPLCKATELVFKNASGEKVCAHVTVHEMPAMPLACGACPAPCAPQQVAMPAPMPVCCPAPAAPAAPLACLPPKPMPAPMPVCCPSAAQAGPYACPLPEPMPVHVQAAVALEPKPSVPACIPVTASVPNHYGSPVPCVCPCAAVTTAKTKAVRFTFEEGMSAFVHRGADGTVVAFKRKTIETAAMGKLSMSAGKACLHVKGSDWKAYAEQIDIREDGCVVLRGNVRLMCDKLGVCASVKAEELCVEVKKGKFDKFVTK